MKTTTFNLIDFAAFIKSESINERLTTDLYCVNLYCVTTDRQYRIDTSYLLEHKGNEYIDFVFTSENEYKSIPLWVSLPNNDDDGNLLAYQISVATEDTATEDTDTATDNLDISTIADLCADFSGIELLELSQKIQAMAVKKIKSENKKNKVNKPEKTQTEKKVSAKNFNYYGLLKSWHGMPTDKIIADGLNGGYSSSVINEDKRVINVLMGTDKDILISQEWIDYIVNFWCENPDTTWIRLHYAFSKGGRKCRDRDLLCNYIIANGVSKEDIEAAIASQN